MDLPKSTCFTKETEMVWAGRMEGKSENMGWTSAKSFTNGLMFVLKDSRVKVHSSGVRQYVYIVLEIGHGITKQVFQSRDTHLCILHLQPLFFHGVSTGSSACKDWEEQPPLTVPVDTTSKAGHACS